MKHFIQTTFKTSDGVNLSYLRAGNGLPVILLHGFLESGACFKSQAQILVEQYDVIVLDQRSHGESEKVPFGLQVARLSKDLFELVTALNLERVSLLGHSMGAAVIWSYIELFGRLPILVVSGRASPIPWKSQEWIHRKIIGSQLVIFEEEEGGKHFMFLENPQRFNRVLIEFLAR
jgi:non-heme chloroperoxidase